MHKFFGAFRRLTPEHLGWLHFKIALGLVWPIALITLTPVTLVGSLGWVVYFMAITTLTGALVSMTGLVMSAQRGTLAVVGLSVELAGLFFFLVGPLTYAITYGVLSVTGFGELKNVQFIPLAIFSYSMVAAIINRIVIVMPRRRREAHDVSKDAR